MARKALLVVVAVLIAAGVALALYARSLLGSENVRRTLESQLAARLGEPVRIGAANASVFPRVALQLTDVSIGSEPAVVLDRVSVSTGLRALFSRRIEGADLLLQGGRVRAPYAAALVGAAAAAPGAPGASAGPVTIVSIREIALEDIELVAGSTSMMLDMQSALTGDRLDVFRLSARSPDVRLHVSGALTSVSRRQGAFEVTADDLDADALAALASRASTAAEGTGQDVAGSGAPLDVTLSITAATGTLAGQRFADLRSEVRVRPDGVAMSPLTLTAHGGTFTGSVQAVTSAAAPELELRATVEGINAAALAEAAGAPASFSGSAGGSVALTARGTSPESLLDTARGTGSLSVTDGEIPGLEMVRAVVLAFGRPSGAAPAGSGSAFTQLGGDFTVEGGTVRTGNLLFLSRDFDMRGDASIALRTGGIDASVDVLLSEELTAQAGTDLRRYTRSNGRIILPARITGTIARPSVMLDVKAATRRAVENELEDRAKSLIEELFRRRKGRD